jgi:hypothetical protein
MEPMMPSALAWRARSLLVQWVMCSPSVMGSRQASSTIWARCRGGNLLGATQARLVQQEGLQPALLVAAADAPDGGRVTLQASGDRPDGLPGGHSQDDTGMLDLEPGQSPGSGNALQDGEVRGSDTQGARFPTTHRSTSSTKAGLYLQHTPTLNFWW